MVLLPCLWVYERLPDHLKGDAFLRRDGFGSYSKFTLEVAFPRTRPGSGSTTSGLYVSTSQACRAPVLEPSLVQASSLSG